MSLLPLSSGEKLAAGRMGLTWVEHEGPQFRLPHQLAAQGDPVLEFGLRRAQGIDGALAASRAAFIGGCRHIKRFDCHSVPVQNFQRLTPPLHCGPVICSDG